MTEMLLFDDLAPATWTERDRRLGLTWRPPACEFTTSGHCSTGNHGRCAHNPGGPHHGGVSIPETYMQLRVDQHLLCVAPPVDVWPGHTWRCSCDCHHRTEAAPL